MLYTQISCGAKRDHPFSTILLADRNRALLHSPSLGCERSELRSQFYYLQAFFGMNLDLALEQELGIKAQKRSRFLDGFSL